MKITNNLELPQVFVKIAESNPYKPKTNSFSATRLLLPAQEIVLQERYYDEMTQDVSDMINMFIGTAFHKFVEDYDDSEFKEMYLKHEIENDLFVSGMIDNYDEDTKTLIDYKTAKVNKVVYEDFDEWKQQGLIYAWLLMKNGVWVERIKFYAVLKDWSEFAKSNSQNAYYPQKPVHLYEFKVNPNDLVEIEEYIKNKIDFILELRKLSTKEILETELEDKYKPIVKFAVYKGSNKRATKLCDSEEEAQQLSSKDATMRIERRVERNIGFEIICKAMQYANMVIKN